MTMEEQHTTIQSTTTPIQDDTTTTTTTMECGNPSSSCCSGSKSGKEGRHPFPVKVYEMLEDSDPNGFSHIVSWNVDGTGFMVHKKDLFIKEIVPQYFNQTRYKSFQRQLSLYGFQRVTVGLNKGLRHHDKLRKGREDLVRQMKPVGYKPRGIVKTPTTVMMLEPSSQGIVASPVATPSTPPMTPHDGEVLPTVISSSSLDKHHLQQQGDIHDQHRLVTPVISEGEESSSEHDDHQCLFAGQSFYLMAPTQEVLQEFLPAPTLTVGSTTTTTTASSVSDPLLKRAWEIGFNSAMTSLKKNAAAATKSTSSSGPCPLAPSPSLLLDDCYDALDFLAVDVTLTPYE